MQWWNDSVNWVLSDDGSRVIATAIVPAAAIILAGIIAGHIGRGATGRIITHFAREQRTSTIAALIGAARKAAVWNQLSAAEQDHADAVALEADVRLRMLPATGATMVADWAAHEIDEMKRNSVSFSFQAEQSLIELHSRLLQWQAKPSRAKKLFKNDLDSWAYEQSLKDQERVASQQAWAAEQAAAQQAAAQQAAAAANAAAASAATASAAATTAATSSIAPAVTAPSNLAVESASVAQTLRPTP